MIPLISCSVRDASAYYQGTVVIHENCPAVFMSIAQDLSVTIHKYNGTDFSTTIVPYNELFTHIFPAFYTTRGAYIGLNVRRSTKRGMEYDPSELPDLYKILRGESPRTTRRYSWSVFVSDHRGVKIVYMNGFPVGVIQGEIWYVRSSDVADRLVKLFDSIGEQDVSIRVV
jgi:hypothetical protein